MAREPLPELTGDHQGLPRDDVRRLRQILSFTHGGDSLSADEAIELILRDGYRRGA